MHGRILTLLASTGLLCAAESRATARPLTDAEVFERVFEQRAVSERVPVVLLVQGVSYGPIVLELRDGAAARMPASPTLAALERSRLRVEIQGRLSDAVRGGELAIDALRAARIHVFYDPRRLELRIHLAPALTESSSHTLGPGLPTEAASAVRPDDVSGYVNMYARGGNATPQHVRLESALNIRRWVLETRGELGESPIGAHRGDVLLSRDVPESALRCLAGDFAVTTGGLQPGFPILGLGVTRNFTLQPYRVIQPVGVFHFTLERAANVTVLVNGAPVQTLALAAGRHDVRDLPLGAGVNDIELLIRDDAGAERRLQFSAASPNELLAPGVVQFSVSLGFPLIEDVGLRDYAWSRPVLSGRRRWGVTERLTLGGSFDGDIERQVAGGAFAVATKLGNLAVDVAGSHDITARTGHAESIRYDYHRVADRTATNTLTIAARRYSPQFRSLAVLDVDGRFRGDLSIASSRHLVARVFARLNARYQVGRDVPDAYDASVAFSRSFGGLSLDVLFGIRDGGNEPRDARVFLTAHWTLPDRQGTLHAASRTSTAAGRSNELRFTTAAGPPPGGVIASASVRESTEAYGSDLGLAYASQRFTSSVTTAMGFDRATGRAITTAAFELGTALAFAGGRVGWSRPITGSFAIIDRNETLADQEIGVNPAAAGSYSARTDRFGPAVVPSLEPYRVGSVRVEAPDLRLGTSLGPASYMLLPAYKSGTLLVVGEPGTVFLRGTLRHADGAPVALAVGELLPIDAMPPSCVKADADASLQQRLDCMSEEPPMAHDAAPPVIMTNRAGRFSVVGVAPGVYALKLTDAAPIRIIIPPGQAGVFSVGVLVVP